MEIITGRLTDDAKIKTLKDKRQVVAFNIAVNDYYKTKEGEKKNEVRYFSCTYWISTKIAESLKKGSIVSLFGKVGLNIYKDGGGETCANLTFHVNNVKIITVGKNLVSTPEVAGSNTDDLPF